MKRAFTGEGSKLSAHEAISSYIHHKVYILVDLMQWQDRPGGNFQIEIVLGNKGRSEGKGAHRVNSSDFPFVF